jgi:hypothetical protein
MRFFIALRLLVHSSSGYSQSKAPFFYWEHIGNMVENVMGIQWEPKKSNTPTIPQKNENSSPLVYVTSPL